jgi:hypothetical protein
VRPADGLALAGPEAPVTASAVYDVVLLAGSPTRRALRLAADLARESQIEVDGEQWVVADVRPSDEGRTQLICIYAA